MTSQSLGYCSFSCLYLRCACSSVPIANIVVHQAVLSNERLWKVCCLQLNLQKQPQTAQRGLLRTTNTGVGTFIAFYFNEPAYGARHRYFLVFCPMPMDRVCLKRDAQNRRRKCRSYTTVTGYMCIYVQRNMAHNSCPSLACQVACDKARH